MRALPLIFASLMMSASPTLAQGSVAYPLTIENCGTWVTLQKAPERVVTIKSTATEMVLALGQGHKIVGVGFQDGPAPEPWTADAAALPVLSEKLPAQEVALAVEPDFIYGGWESNFAADGVGERAKLLDLGIATYVSPAACRSVKPEKLTFDEIFEEIAEIGAMLDAQTAAAQLIAQQRETLANIASDERGLTALWYSSGTKVPYVGAGSNAPQMMMEALGVDNIMAEVDDGWVSASWEAVAAADPDVIVLVDSSWNSAAQKKKLLVESPITSKMSAVVHGRYLELPFPASEAGVRNVGATADMAKQLQQLTFDP
jgi:iron complex transport system substrate-binding protein